MKFPVTMYRDEADFYVVDCPIIPGCMSQGLTPAEALENIAEAIQLQAEMRRKHGEPVTRIG